MQYFYDPEFEGNITEYLSYNCPKCNDTGRIIDFSGHGVFCRNCCIHKGSQEISITRKQGMAIKYRRMT